MNMQLGVKIICIAWYVYTVYMYTLYREAKLPQTRVNFTNLTNLTNFDL